MSSKQRVVQALTVVDDLLDGTLQQASLPAEASRVVRQGFSILCSSLRDDWRVVEESPGLVRRVAGRVCEILRFEDEAVMFVACQLLFLLGLSAPEVLLEVPQARTALASFLVQPVPSPVAVTGVQILGRLLTCGLNLRTSRSGTVVELTASRPCQPCKEADMTDDNVKRLVSPQTVHALCKLLGGCVGQWGPQGVSLARRIMSLLSLLLHKNQQAKAKYFPGLTKQLVDGRVPSLVMQMVRVSLGLHCPVTLLVANDLLQHICKAEPSVAEDLVCKVFDPNIQLGTEDNRPHSANTAISCLFWLNSLAVAVCQSQNLERERVMEVLKAQDVLGHLKQILNTVDATVDAGWFLNVNHVFTAVLTPLLIKLSVRNGGLTALQTEIRQVGLLKATHRSLNTASGLVRKLCEAGGEVEPDLADLESALYVYCNLLFFQTLVQCDNPTVVADCASARNLEIVLETLQLYSEFLCTLKDPDLASLGARALEECLGLLESTLFACLDGKGKGAAQVVRSFIRRGGVVVLVGQLQSVASNPFLAMAQRVSALTKHLQCLLYLSKCIRGSSQLQRGDVLEEVGIKHALEGIKLFVQDVVGYRVDEGLRDNLKTTMDTFRHLENVYS